MADPTSEFETAEITTLVHQLNKKKSFVRFEWNSNKRLGLEVPFGTALEDVEAEAVKALQKHSEDMAQMSLKIEL